MSAFARADSLTLTTGKTLTGKITFDAKNAVTIGPKDQPSVHADLRDVIALKIDPARPTPPARVAVLIDGTRVAASEVLSMNDRELRLKRPDGTVLGVNAALVSSIDFAPAVPHAPPANGFVGAQLGDKDFTEGDVVSMTPSAVKISSVLFGVQEFDTAKSVRAVYLRPPGVSKSAYVVRGRDGSTWQATTIATGAGKLTLTTDLAGPIAIAAVDVLSVDLGPASADGLASLTTSPSPTLALTPGQQQNFAVAGKYRTVVLTFRVPDTYMPMRSARLILLADDKEIARSEPLTSLDGPVTITRAIDYVKQLTMKLDVTGVPELGIVGAISDGRLIR